MTGHTKVGVFAAAVIILFDQLSKWLILELLEGRYEHVVVTPFFNLVLVWNRGVSFGMMNTASPFAPWLLSGLALIVAIGLLLWLRRAESWLLATGLGLVIGGALGNVIDRMRFGAVIDFLDVHAAGYHWPAFNVADASIFVGAGLLLADSLLTPERRTT
jgi:signal peptidase II